MQRTIQRFFRSAGGLRRQDGLALVALLIVGLLLAWLEALAGGG